MGHSSIINQAMYNIFSIHMPIYLTIYIYECINMYASKTKQKYVLCVGYI